MYNRDAPSLSKRSQSKDVVDLYSGEQKLHIGNSYYSWLTNGEWNEEKYTQYMFLKQLPVLGPYTDFLTSYYDDMIYMQNNQISWDDVKRPWKLSSASAGSHFMRSSINFVSSNIKRLYH